MHSRTSAGFVITAAAALVLSGCATSAATRDAGASSGVELVRVVASTNVYGDIASRVGGDLVDVTSIITSAAQDPHSYEASAQDQLAISKADLVIENGGGYDPFIDTLIGGSGAADVVVLNASDASGLMEGGDEHAEDEHAEEENADSPQTENDGPSESADAHVEGFNEHVWYDFAAVDAIARELADRLSEIDSANADAYDQNYADFAAELAALQGRADGLEQITSGKAAAITEPVPLYLLSDAGLSNSTPEEFSEAIEEGTDVSPAVLQETMDLFAGGDIALLAYNEQTAGPETDKVREAAETAGVPVVSFTETLPDGDTYLEWMGANLDAIEAAVS